MTYTIGQFARLAGITAKALRHYGTLGLLRPRAIDSRTRYRRYGTDQLPELAAILALRDLGLPLAAIAALVRRRGTGAERRRSLERLRERLAGTLEATRRSLAWVEAELDELSAPVGAPPIRLRHAPALSVASLRRELRSYGEIEEVERELRASVPTGLRGLHAGVVWHRCAEAGAPDGEAFIEIRSPLPSRAARLAGELPPTMLACAYTDGGDASTQDAYAALHRWARARRLRPTGVAREIYLGSMLEAQICVEPAGESPSAP